MATIIDSLIVTLGLDASNFQDGSEKAKKTQRTLTTETDAATKKMAAGYSLIRKEILLMVSALTAGVGLVKFFSNTISSAASLGYLAENLSMTTERINAYQRASERMNGSAGGMTAQLKESVDTLAQLRMGMGPTESLQWFSRMGGNPQDLKDGNTYLMARAKIVHDLFQQDPAKAALAARQMGILDDQFDLIKQGPEAFQALADAQEKNSAITAQNAKEAQELLRRWLDFTDAIKGTVMKAMLALAPAITLVLGVFVKWANQVASNKEGIQSFGRDLTNFLTKTDWSGIIKDAKDFAGSINSIATSIKELINRWDEFRGKPLITVKDILKGQNGEIAKGVSNTVTTFAPLAESDHPVIDFFTGGPINKFLREVFSRRRPGDPVPQNQPQASAGEFKTLMDKSKYATSKLMSMGWTQSQAAGMVGSLMQESKMNESSVNSKSGAYGLAQWLSKDRIANFEKWAGRPLVGSSFDQQLDFMNYEMTKGSESKAGDAVRKTKTAEMAAEVHRKTYERPGDDEANDVMRRAYARQIEQGMQQANAAAATRVPAGPAASVASRVDNRKTSTATSETVINGGVHINTQATDGKGIMKEIQPGIAKYNSTMQANTGVN